MKRITLVLFIVLMAFSLASAEGERGWVRDAVKFDRSKPLRKLAKRVKKSRRTRPREMKNNLKSQAERGRKKGSKAVDQAWQSEQASKPAGPVISSWTGLRNADNAGRVAPPDPNMDVGPNHVVQAVNLVYGIWDKSGNVLLAPTATNALWSGFGGQCEFSNDGDPIVNYDPLADRWVLSQFVFSASQCIAVSTGPDPLGSYYRYEFATPGNDYPKMGVWNDSYTATIRNFSGAFNMDAVVFERAKMLTGASAKMVVKNMSSLLPGIDGFLSVDVDGPAPKAGTQPLFAGADGANDRLALFQMHMDWPNTANMHLDGPNFISVSPIDGSMSRSGQPGTTTQIDVHTFATMFRLAYRNMGTHETLVICHTVDVNNFNNHAGFRWYELRDTGSGWALFQEGTYAPDNDNRFMGSVAMNAAGDIMGGYSVASKGTFPSIRYAGRNASDPLGQFTIQEGYLTNGTASQTGTSRWGDYSSILVDPSDDMTFWYTTEYSTGSWDWETTIGSFSAGQPDLGFTCTADNPPAIIPTTGGSFDYTMTLTNNTGTATTADVWAYAQRDGSGKTDPLFQQMNVNVGANSTTTLNLTLNLNRLVDPDNFSYMCRAGDFFQAPVAGDAFPFSIVVPPSASREGVLAKGAPIDQAFDSVLRSQSNSGSSSDGIVPEGITLEDNYPNPFNPTTKINYSVKEASKVTLKIFNTLGQEVKTLVSGYQQAGSQTVVWDATNSAGQAVSAGVYVYKLEANGVVLTKKMSFVK